MVSLSINENGGNKQDYSDCENIEHGRLHKSIQKSAASRLVEKYRTREETDTIFTASILVGGHGNDGGILY